jgi:hypothetical protein
MTRQELKDQVDDHLGEMIISLEDRFEVEFAHDHWAWNNLADKITDHLMQFQILSKEEIQDNELLNQADALGDEERGR